MSDFKILLNYEKNGKSHKLDSYLKRGGYQTVTKKLAKHKPEEIIDEVKKSGIRGRGG